RRLTAVLAQNDIERERFIALGADPTSCVAAGNLKYAAAPIVVGDSSLRGELGLSAGESVVVFGSIHRDEVRGVFAAIDRLPIDDLRIIIAPRHEAAIAAIGRECRRRAWQWHRRTAGSLPANWRILLLDRMGELSRAYAIASVGVVGGGFERHGGHNPLEPIMAGTPVIFGRHFQHFVREVGALTAATPEAQVRAATELAERLTRWLADASERRRVLALQRQALPDGAAIAKRYVAALSPWLDGC
ncbi:MAG TPA: hypothetical protein VL403_14105, partial [Candidatus Kryptonia bacterium]|nr:hypothetical protein [Candidatus Kryptonia bacterium]